MDYEYRRPSFLKTLLLVILCIVVSGVSGFGGAYLYDTYYKKQDVVVQQPSTPVQTIVKIDSNDMTSVVTLVKDSVVEITTEVTQNSFFWGEYTSEGAGSGVIVSSDGYIVTNNHVISGATKTTVKLTNGSTYEATLVGTDEQTDLAVIKIDANDLTFAQMGDSTTLLVGQDVFAIGNPLGTLGGTVSEGIISALERELYIDNQKMILMQTTAAVNPGNSGGGLFNLNGELIGIVSAKSSGSDVEGLGFAIPISNAKVIVDDLMTHGYVTGRPQMGISVVYIYSRQAAFQYNVNKYGTYIYQVLDGSAAADAGLQAGDLLISINGTQIDEMVDISNFVQEYKVGDSLEVLIERDGEQMIKILKLKEKTQ
ncbi:MAG: trypsin-like peptidase domain-containing protein [Erysipelotrichaceae bacterium]|nr:trypsin-like peptidase domain-containing protein [Erysipelotrichaceae bacterium]